jgi:NitT/TauT family transport system permease protein
MPVNTVDERRYDIALRSISLLLLLALWQLAASAVASSLLPGPLPVAARLYIQALRGDLFFHLGMTLFRVAASFVVAMGIGTAIGIAMGRHRRADRLFDLWLMLGLNLPALVIMILCYVWLGLGEPAAILAVALNKIPTVAVTMREGARALDRDLLQVADVLRLTWVRRMRKVFLPPLYPYFMASARNGLALIWKLVLVVELLGRSNGVGFQLYVFFQYFDITGVFAYTAAFTAVVMSLEVALVRPLERRLTRWRP